ncbi:MAG: hypothetical protein WBW94_03540 [Anaerolineales bacterium]
MKPLDSNRILWKPFIVLVVILAVIAACSSPNTAVPSPALNDVATVVAATMEAIQVQATPTAISPTVIPSPTLSPLPPTPVLPAATRLTFVDGATSGSVMGTIQPGQVLYYVLNASQEQPLIVDLTSTNGDATMTIKTASGIVLLNTGQNLNMPLTVTEDYYISVNGGASAENFSLSISTPARIQFSQGAISETLSGQTASGFTIAPPRGGDVSYVIFANQGQQINLNLNGVGKNGVLAMYGFSDGQPYLRYVTAQTTFSMKLPSTQDYIIQVVPRAGMVINYTLLVTVQ